MSFKDIIGEMDRISYLFIILEFVLVSLFIYNDNKYHNPLSILLKTLASLMFVLLAIRLYKGNTLLIIVALVFDMLGDFILILRNKYKNHKDLVFVIGTLSFFIAHILYSTYLIKLNPKCIPLGLVFNAILYLGVAMYFLKTLDVHGKMKMLGACYLLIIMFTSGLAISNYINVTSHANFVLMVASIIFICSDLILMIYKFNKNAKNYLQISYRILYYISQMLLAVYVSLV